MILVIDGPDETGKTKYCTRLIRNGDFKVYKHHGPSDSSPRYLMAEYEKFRNEDAIFDRWWPSEWVYHPDNISQRMERVCDVLAKAPDIIYEIWIREGDTSPLAEGYREVAAKFGLEIVDPYTSRRKNVNG